ncbi:zinc metalloprotease [Basidiobolus ranarum]|uniref:CAAX prenyl protease n=1 Tax=Basidiobolus ranarum TaxID=34480 RepID=A0ABR2W8Q7_9FUNG
MESLYKEYVLGLSYASYIFITYLNYRQLRKLQYEEQPKILTKLITSEEFNRINAYGIDKSKFLFLGDALSQLQNTAVIYFNLLAWLWNLAGRWLTLAGYSSGSEIAQSVIFFILISSISSITALPFSLYNTFVIEARHGSRTLTVASFFISGIKGYLFGGAVGVPLIATFLYIIQWSGDRFYFYVWMFAGLFQFLMVSLYPTLIQPLFHEFKPLQDEELKGNIENLARRIGFPLSKIYVVPSEPGGKAHHGYSYFFGFSPNKHIAIFESALQETTKEEVCAILCHELGHWKYNHVTKLFIIHQIHLFGIFYVFSHFINNSNLYRAFGFESKPVLVGFMLFQYIFSPFEGLATFLTNALRRKQEFQADEFSKRHGYGEPLRTGLVRLNKQDSSNLILDSWYSTYHYSHPPLVDRLRTLVKTD